MLILKRNFEKHNENIMRKAKMFSKPNRYLYWILLSGTLGTIVSALLTLRALNGFNDSVVAWILIGILLLSSVFLVGYCWKNGCIKYMTTVYVTDNEIVARNWALRKTCTLSLKKPIYCFKLWWNTGFYVTKVLIISNKRISNDCGGKLFRNLLDPKEQIVLVEPTDVANRLLCDMGVFEEVLSDEARWF